MNIKTHNCPVRKPKQKVKFVFEPDGTPCRPINEADYLTVPVIKNGRPTKLYIPTRLLLILFAALATVTADTQTNSYAPGSITGIIHPMEIVQPSSVFVFRIGQTDHAVNLLTNRVTNVLSILSTLPVPGACPECGAPNHHMAQVRLLSVYDVVYLTATSPGHSNAMRIATGSATNWVSTNLIPRTVQPYTSPGAWPASVPPLNQAK